MGTLDCLLAQLKLSSSVFCLLNLNGCQGLSKSEHRQGAPFHLVLSGIAWVRLPGESQLICLEKGDMLIIPAGYHHDVLSEPGACTQNFNRLLGQYEQTPGINGSRQPEVITVGKSGDSPVKLVTGIFNFDQSFRNPLVTSLPDYLHLHARANPWLYPLLTLLVSELESGRPGSGTVAVRLADILFIQAIREVISGGDIFRVGWLNGLTDPQISKALALIHQNPGRRWSVALLGNDVGMSRSRFAERFRTIMGQSPISYLTEWRMYLAAGKLLHSQIRLTRLAEQSGYESDVAFIKAFKKWSGYTPSVFRAHERAKRQGNAYAPASPEL